MRSGNTKSCGCIKQEQRQAHGTHHDAGRNRKRLYKIWAGIKNRCYNANGKESYEKYGGRGITMCDEWLDSYEAFRSWAYSNGYRDNLTIDRIDFNGPYSPENCRWTTQKKQQNNRSNNHLLTFNGETRTIAEWSELAGFGRSVIQHRLDRGWTIESALQTPMRILVDGHYVCSNTGIGAES